MEACLRTGVPYLDTANYEPPEEARFEYSHQWALHDRFREAGLMALLGSGFDPGVTSVFATYIRKHLLDEICTLDILDCNGGEHGRAFATNFNPEINIREVTAPARHWEGGRFHESPALSTKPDLRLPRGRRAVHVPDVSRGAGEPRAPSARDRAHPLLDDLRRELPHPSARAGGRRHDLDHSP